MEKTQIFISSASRNKLIISNDDTVIKFIDFGKIIAQELKNIDKNKIVFKLNQIIETFIINNKTQHKEFGETIAIENIGLLLEPELKFNVEKFLSDYSQNNTLILKWDGEIDTNQLYFLTKNDNHKIDLSNISHIVI